MTLEMEEKVLDAILSVYRVVWTAMLGYLGWLHGLREGKK